MAELRYLFDPLMNQVQYFSSSVIWPSEDYNTIGVDCRGKVSVTVVYTMGVGFLVSNFQVQYFPNSMQKY